MVPFDVGPRCQSPSHDECSLKYCTDSCCSQERFTVHISVLPKKYWVLSLSLGSGDSEPFEMPSGGGAAQDKTAVCAHSPGLGWDLS